MPSSRVPPIAPAGGLLIASSSPPHRPIAPAGGLLIAGLLSLRPLLVPIPTLSRSSTLVFLASLTGAFEASRATGGFGRLFGSLLFLLAAVHALWLMPQARAFYAQAIAALLPYLPGDPTPAAPPPYIRLDEPVVDLEAALHEPPPLSSMSPPPIALRGEAAVGGEAAGGGVHGSGGFNPYEHEPFVAPGTNPSPGTKKMST